MPWGLPGYRRFVPQLTWQWNPQAELVVSNSRPADLVVDLGAGGRRIAPHVRTVDFLPVANVDIVSDVTRLPFADDSVDLAIGTGLLEHVEDEHALMAEIARVVKPGGKVHFEVPFLEQYHEDPIDCRRFTVPGLERLVTRYGFTPVSSGPHIGPTVTIITLLAHYVAIALEGPTLLNKVLANGSFVALSTVLFPLKYLDAYLGRKKNAHQIAMGIYCTASKNIDASASAG